MDEQLEELLKKELEEKQAEKKKKEEQEKQRKEAEKFAVKLTAIIFGIALLIGIIVGVVMCSKPKDYEYKVTNIEVMEWSDTQAIVDIYIKNNTDKKKYISFILEIYDEDELLIAYKECAFLPPPKSADTYKTTITYAIQSLHTAKKYKITSFFVMP